MKELKIFILKNCPYCQNILMALKNVEFEDIKVEIIDEHENPEIADAYDYYYVPTLFLDGQKIYEGAINREEAKELVSFIQKK